MKKIFTLFAAVLMAGSMMALEATLLTPGVPTTTYEDEYYYFVTTGAGQVTFTVDATGDMEYDLYNEAGQYQGVDIILSMLNNHTYVWNCPAAGTYYWQHFSSGSTTLTITGSIFDAPAELATLTAEVIDNGSAVLVTPSDEELYWQYKFFDYYAERDSAEFIENTIGVIYSTNEMSGEMAWDIMSYDAKVGTQTVNAPGWLEDGDEVTFVAYGIANAGDGTVKLASNVVYIAQFVYGATPTALTNQAAAAKAQKLIQNGQVVILRDGKRFNLVGAEL